ncbi:MAG: hypothetical protein ACM3SQ_03210 [Betaproteobacteria bacterium]
MGRQTIYRRKPTSPVRVALVPLVSPHANAVYVPGQALLRIRGTRAPRRAAARSGRR